MINIGINSAALLGLLDLVLVIVIFVMTLSITITTARSRTSSNILALYIVQLIIVPWLLLVCGGIFLTQGWRLDPILNFSVWCLHGIMIFLLVKDFYLYQDR